MAQTPKEKKKAKRKASASRKRLVPRKEQRGVLGDEARLDVEDPSLAPIAARVKELGGAAVGAYREPLSGKPILVAVLPIKVVEPTPFQRDLSPTHTKRLAQRIEETGVFLDPLIVVQAPDGRFWTPNGRHRLAAAKVLGLRSVTALVCPDEDLAFRILALNTEKAHNLKDRSLEVIRMARELALRRPRSKETDYESELEEPALITLGIVYQSHGRFAGSPYFSFLRKLDRFQTKTLPKSLSEREGFAARLLEIDESVKEIVEALKKRGFRSPYLRNYVVARINPVRFHRARKGDSTPPMAMGAALTRMAAAAKKFDTSSVREQDLALVAAVSSAE
ncbi:MAG TPA: ParB N-terminal domain-containing protein [Vicinamibacteria bacterium]|nr:ParB N-terminal domain-containing protein [Vicinamibacteria bacterium]